MLKRSGAMLVHLPGEERGLGLYGLNRGNHSMSVEVVNKNFSSLKESALERLEPGYYSQRDTCGRGNRGMQLGSADSAMMGREYPRALLVHSGTHILGKKQHIRFCRAVCDTGTIDGAKQFLCTYSILEYMCSLFRLPRSKTVSACLIPRTSGTLGTLGQ